MGVAPGDEDGEPEEEESTEMPDVRGGGTQKIDFTEKKFPHMPARESQIKEPPHPKSKKIEKDDGQKQYIDIEDKDPVWLKDKGDNFYKRNDLNAALNAYSKAIAGDPEFFKAYLNRATVCLRMRNF